MAEVSYICKRTVVSTVPVQPGKTHTLSCFERLMDPNHHLMLVFYYQTRRAMAPGELTKRLRVSLAETLTSFPVIMGRLVRLEIGEDMEVGDNQWMVKCNDAGVRMIEARAEGSVERWLERVDREKEKKYMVYWENMSSKPYFWATFYIQVTEFEEGGVAIGLSCTHLLADLVSVTHFVQAWADISTRGKMMHPPIFHRFSTPHLSRSTIPVCHTNYTTISLAFSDSMVRSCISTQAWDGSDPSPFEALAGLIWGSVSRARGLREGLVGFTIGMDMRKVLGLDQGYFGNCMVYANLPEAATNTHLAAKAIGEVIKSEMNREGIIDPQNRTLQQFHNLLGINLEHVHYPVSSFGEGLEGPICARYYVNSICEKGSFLILPFLHGDGPFSRVVMLSLPQHELFKLCKDELILSFNPNIWMGAD